MIDTESTGTKHSQVCQLAYIDLSHGELEAGNLFFTVDEMSDYAREVHGFSVSALERLSKGKRFADSAEMVKKLLFGKCIVGHAIGCDLRALQQEFARCHIAFKAAQQFCTMTHFRPIMNIRLAGQPRPKEPSLTELCDYLDVRSEAVQGLSQALYGDPTQRHDARYDTCATYLCAAAAQRTGKVRGLFPRGW